MRAVAADPHRAPGDMWASTLVIFLSDNGGPIYEPGSASNFPLRGGKYNDFDGGTRYTEWAVKACVSSWSTFNFHVCRAPSISLF